MEEKMTYERTEDGVRILSGTAYIAYICSGGSGFNIAVAYGDWREGSDEIIAVCSSREEADKAIDDYMDRL